MCYNLTDNGKGIDDMRNRLFLLLLFVLAAVALVSCNQDAESKTFTVTFMANDEGATGEMSPQKVERYVSESLAANKFTKEGWKFKSWNTKADGTGNAYFDKSTIRLAKDITLYAQWEYNQVTVTFYPNGGSGEMPSQKVNKKENTPLSANTFTRDNGFVFTGWNTKADGTGESYADKTNVTLTADLTLYAQWYHDQVEVTFMPNGGTGDSYKQQVYTGMPQQLDGNKFTPPVDNTFMYWTPNADGTGDRIYDRGDVNITENLTLYAQWINADIITSDSLFLGNGKTYTLIENVTLSGRAMVFSGSATIILPEGLTLTAPKGLSVLGTVSGSLIITGTGSLNATAEGGAAAIGGESGFATGDITINGGTIIATGGPDGGAGIGGGKDHMSEGTVTFNPSVTVQVSDDGISWTTDGSTRKRFMKVTD